MLTQHSKFNNAWNRLLVCICVSIVSLAVVGCKEVAQTPDSNSAKNSSSDAATPPVEQLPESAEMTQQAQPVENPEDAAKIKKIRALIEERFAQKKVPEEIIHIPPQTTTGYGLNRDGKVISIMLDFCPVTDDDVAEICQLDTIRYIGLGGTGVTDASLEEIKKLPLTGLELRHTQISKKSMVHMKEMKTLKQLALPLGFDEKSQAELQEALPGCTVYINNNYR